MHINLKAYKRYHLPAIRSVILCWVPRSILRHVIVWFCSLKLGNMAMFSDDVSWSPPFTCSALSSTAYVYVFPEDRSGVPIGELLVISIRPPMYSSLIHSMLCEYEAMHTNWWLSPGQADTPCNVELNLGEGGSPSDVKTFKILSLTLCTGYLYYGP